MIYKYNKKKFLSLPEQVVVNRRDIEKIRLDSDNENQQIEERLIIVEQKVDIIDGGDL